MEITFKFDNDYERRAFNEMRVTYANAIFPVWRELKETEGVNKESYSYQKIKAGVEILTKLHFMLEEEKKSHDDSTHE